ncbi:MAG: zinc ribbon domain-containing protein [Proteiniphilum sp.]|nr:zinc ribbon domain-containing protein [Proteiniphilum sp.]
MIEAVFYLLGLALIWIVGSKFEEHKMVKCKACGKEISKKAKTCPHCGERNRSPIHTVLNIALIIFIIYTILNMIQPKLVISLLPYGG